MVIVVAYDIAWLVSEEVRVISTKERFQMGLRFEKVLLQSGETVAYLLVIGRCLGMIDTGCCLDRLKV